MEEQSIQAAIAFLDTSVPREGARVRLRQYGGGPDESEIIANERGFLRLGIAFLKAAHATPRPGSSKSGIELDLDDLLTDDSTIVFDFIDRDEVVPESSSPNPEFRWIIYLVFAGLGLIVVLAVVGVLSIIRWILG